MFQKILISNRGEIACRVIRTARRMGIATVAVHSDADADALHVRLADEAVRIGPAPATESYLSIPAILDACRRTGADAVHPGYGFLSERAAFAQDLEAAGIRFIGPNARAIELMGDKIRSKEVAVAAGVSVVPGSAGAIETLPEAERVAEGIGYPVMVKASAGGGGKGMRVARSGAELREGYERARSEAASSFGDDRVFVERFIENPRHVEIQVLGDRHGHVIHLGERECSIQRRNQKVLEEAPSPLLDEATRELMGAQAVALARAVGYDSAGTVEFVAGQDRSFFFLEMNTRLQVEHPVTELVTGLDLVEEMIRAAAGEPLRLRQTDVRFHGWAVESRIYAEDPERGFLPATGRITTWKPPTEGRDAAGALVRIDTGVDAGAEISLFYDPMIAKLVTHAPTRADAIEAQSRSLDGCALEGPRHNIAFLQALQRHPRWREGRLSTGLIAEEFGQGFTPPEPEGEAAIPFVVVAAALDERMRRRDRQIGGRLLVAVPGGEAATERVVRFAGSSHPVLVEPTEAGVVVSGAFGRCAVDARWRPGDPLWQGHVDGVERVLRVRSLPGAWEISGQGYRVHARVLRPREAALDARMPPPVTADGQSRVLCPMPGLVRQLLVSADQQVESGDALCVVEAMKMENVLRAERAGRIGAVHVREGDVLAMDQPILDYA